MMEVGMDRKLREERDTLFQIAAGWARIRTREAEREYFYLYSRR